MDWLTGIALLPVLLCGGMMIGGMLLGALGLRRATTPPEAARDDATDPADPNHPSELTQA